MCYITEQFVSCQHQSYSAPAHHEGKLTNTKREIVLADVSCVTSHNWQAHLHSLHFNWVDNAKKVRRDEEVDKTKRQTK